MRGSNRLMLVRAHRLMLTSSCRAPTRRMTRASGRSIPWSSRARADLADIWSYHARTTGPHTADNLVRSIGKACSMLYNHPNIGRPRDEICRGLRSIAAGPYVVFYRFQSEGGPEVVRIIDARRDL